MADSRRDSKFPDRYADVDRLRTPDSAAMSPPQLPWSTFQSPVQSLDSTPVLPATIVARSAQSHKASAYATPTYLSHHPFKKTHHGGVHQATSVLPGPHAAPSASVPSTWSPTPPESRSATPHRLCRSAGEQPEELLTAEPPSYSPAKRIAAHQGAVGQPANSPFGGTSVGQADQDFNFGQDGGPGWSFWYKQAWALCVVIIVPSSWPPLPSKCTESPRLDGNIANLVFSRSRRFNVEPNNTVFCVYNVTRFKSLPGASPRTYAPQNMPFGYCRSVVYWSMGVGADKVESRAEKFDHTYGAAMLRQLVTSSKGPKTILLALGGYQSDSVHLTKIARHQSQLESFTKSVVEKVALYAMDGVAVHWVPPEAGCRVPGQDDDLLTVSTIVDAISKAFTDRAAKRVIALLLPADHAATDTLVNVLVNMVDYVIVQTHLLPLPPGPSGELCNDLARSSTNFIRSLSLSPEQDKKVCSGFSLSPLEGAGDICTWLRGH
ncbi:hypothetical protein MTO96_012949 [Rhipicephalus appendiculatus]